MSELKLPSYGGQAIIEGVLMRGEYAIAACMRAPDGNITIQKEKLAGVYTSSIKKIPFLRGLLILWDALGLGIKYLTISANVQTGEDEKLEGFSLYATLGFSLALSIVIFFLAPAAAIHWLQTPLGIDPWTGNLLEGVIRLILIILYIWGIGQIPDIKRVFTYHGAEHKTINAFEAGAELNPKTVKGYSLEHPRCGTSFILIVVVFSLVGFALIGPLPLGMRLLSRIILIPIIAGIAYEYIRWTSRNISNPVVRILSKPSMAMQKLTTREPTIEILEVAISAFKSMYELEMEINPKFKSQILSESVTV